jgi:hypothetical protein
MKDEMAQTVELQRLNSDGPGWKHWGPYLSERAWGTVREDYSTDGSAWDYFPHDHARSKAYRWGDDGIAGICDEHQRLCFALALWNGADPILKERLFGLTGPEGNHGEDVKEYYYYLDSTPTHSYMKFLYKYPQRPFPYADLIETNRERNRLEPEYELIDTGIFDEDRYFDVFVEYAKAHPKDILVRISAVNRGPDPAELHVLPTLWFRNTWTWGNHPNNPKPSLWLYEGLRSEDRGLSNGGNEEGTNQDPALDPQSSALRISAQARRLGHYTLHCEGTPDLLFTENDTNLERLYGAPNPSPYVKDGINNAIVNGQRDAVNPEGKGTKAAAHYRVTIPPGETVTIRLRLETSATSEGKEAAEEKKRTAEDGGQEAEVGKDERESDPKERIIAHLAPFEEFDSIFEQRIAEAGEFYAALQPASLNDDERNVQRQAFAGMLLSKQFYHYDVGDWLNGDPNQPPPPAQRRKERNHEWEHFNSADIISMPDKWEYPWFASWDTAFHCIPLALLDPDFAKSQLILLGREWYQHPNGQIPAYEWAFGDVNPPVLAWAAWRVYKIEQKMTGNSDRTFLERVFHKLLLNFNWWVNRKDAGGKNIFQGGFLGLDNIGVFDRSAPLPTGGHIEQSDGTSWMGMFSLNMMTIALELAQENMVYEDIATKFFEHFLYIAHAMNNIGGEGLALWNQEDEFFYDVLHIRGLGHMPLKVRSMVGLIPLFAVATIEPALLDKLPGFKRRLKWFLTNRPQLAKLVSRWRVPGMGERRLLALLRGHRMKSVLRRMLDETEFLSPYGVRALSRYHADNPYTLQADGREYVVDYEPAESTGGTFGGNSNWRGPVWLPVNYLIIESLQQFHHFYDEEFKVECPTGSGQYLSLDEVADELSRRLISLFVRDGDGKRPAFGGQERFQTDPHWRDYLLFYEYFHGDNGAGLGASHQTGWTGVIAKLLEQQGEKQNKS